VALYSTTLLIKAFFLGVVVITTQPWQRARFVAPMMRQHFGDHGCVEWALIERNGRFELVSIKEALSRYAAARGRVSKGRWR
jgi:hypothetical protein